MSRRTSLRGARLVVRLLCVGLLTVAFAGVGGTAGWWWGERQAGSFEATVVILLNPLQGNPFSPDSRGEDLVNLETEAQLVTSDTVVKRVALEHPDLPPLDVADVAVSVPPNTQLLDIAVTATAAEVAERTAAALGQVYLAHRRNRTASALFNERANINEQLDERTSERATLTQSLGKAKPGSAESVQVTQQVLAVVTQISELRAQLGAVGAASLDPGQVVTPAEVAPHGPLTSGPRVPAALGALLGLAGGLALVSGLARPDGLVRDVADLEGLPGEHLPSWVSVMREVEGTVTGGARLRALTLAAGVGRRVVVLVCRVGPGSPGPAARVLADSFVASRLRTVTVDVGDPRPQDVVDGPGLVEVLRDDVALSGAVTWCGERGRLTVGSATDPLDDLVASLGMEHVVVALREVADVVLLDAGSASSARTLALLPHVDVVLLEVRSGAVTLGDIEDELVELRVAGAVGGGGAGVGVVLVPSERRRRPRRRRHLHEMPATSQARPTHPDEVAAQSQPQPHPHQSAERLSSVGGRVEAEHE